MRVKEVLHQPAKHNHVSSVSVVASTLIRTVHPQHNAMRLRVRLSALLFVVVSACLLLLLLTIFELRSIRTDHDTYHHEEQNIRAIRSHMAQPASTGLTYAIFARDWETSGYLQHVIKVLDHYGYTRIELDNKTQNWDLLWAHDYPYTKMNLKQLKPHQKINHFPGTGYITNKMDLATTNMSQIPKAFLIPDHKSELLKFASANPSKLFVQKSNNHRGIVIKPIAELDLKSGGSFVQEYVDNPLLIDGYKFDIGLYTAITNIDPLNVYVYSGEVLFRFCPTKYHPFDPKNVDKYVIGDDYLPTWEVPSLKHYYNNLGYGMKESFDAYVRAKGKNPEKVWTQVDEAIRSITLNKEPMLQQLLKYYSSKNNFFEMMRFDFVIDDDLNVFVMEANMSPNLSSAHFPPNRLLYEQVLFNLFSLAGLGLVHNRMKKTLDASMEVALKNLVVESDSCSRALCHSCESPECLVCKQCLSDSSLMTLQKQYLQYINRRDMRRVFPPRMNKDGKFNSSLVSMKEDQLSPENQLSVRWFRGKCLQNSDWC
uniref:Tubulin polyglutamylase TTLL4 n=1 Tax=Cacopsylla melanoneura TaxID=428564 RepID=A0A8D8QD87_9HEMI